MTTASDIAVENVEAVIRGEITEPSPGTLAARVLEFAKRYQKRHINGDPRKGKNMSRFQFRYAMPGQLAIGDWLAGIREIMRGLVAIEVDFDGDPRFAGVGEISDEMIMRCVIDSSVREDYGLCATFNILRLLPSVVTVSVNGEKVL